MNAATQTVERVGKRSPTSLGPSVSQRLAETPQTPGKRLKQRREELGLKQSDVAASLGLSRTAYCQYETDSSKLTVDRAELAADILSVAPQWLAFGIGSEDTAPVVKEVDYIDGEFKRTRSWAIDEEFLKRAYDGHANKFGLFHVISHTPSLKPNDVALIQRGAEPSAGVAEFLFAIGGKATIANLTKLPRSDKVRIYGQNKVNEVIDESDIEIYGRVVGKFSID